MKPLLTLFSVLFFLQCFSQTQVYKHAIDLPKSFIYDRTDVEQHLLANEQNGNLFFMFKDNKKVEFALLNNAFKLQKKFEVPTSETGLNSSWTEYTGGISENAVAHFFFETKKGNRTTYHKETVDFNTQKNSLVDLLELPEEEKRLFSFSDHNRFFVFSANDQENELVLYMVNSSGKIKRKSIPIKLPGIKNRRKDKVSEYLKDVHIIKDDEEPGLEAATKSVKLFSNEANLVLMANDKESPTYTCVINLDNLNFIEGNIDHSSLLNTPNKQPAYINSFYTKGNVLSLILNGKDIRIAAYDLTKGQLIKSLEINEENSYKIIGATAVSEERKGKKTDQKSIDDFKKLVKVLSADREGVMAQRNNQGQIIVTVGTYEAIEKSSGGGGGGLQLQKVTPDANSTRYNPQYMYVPKLGSPSYMTTAANFYKSSYFKLLLDVNTFTIAKGRIPQSVNDRIKDYVEDVDKNKKSYKKQFAIGDKQYYSFYDKEAKAYVIEQIAIAR